VAFGALCPPDSLLDHVVCRWDKGRARLVVTVDPFRSRCGVLDLFLLELGHGGGLQETIARLESHRFGLVAASRREKVFIVD